MGNAGAVCRGNWFLVVYVRVKCVCVRVRVCSWFVVPSERQPLLTHVEQEPVTIWLLACLSLAGKIVPVNVVSDVHLTAISVTV